MATTRRSVVLGIAMVSMAALLGACADTDRVSMAEAPAPGFLPDPQLLQKGGSGELDLVYLNSSADLGAYNQIMLEPVTIWAGSGSAMKDASPKEQKALANSFYTDLYNAAAKRCTMVSEPSPGTARFKVAIVGAQSANPILNTISTYEPHIRLLDELAGDVFNDGVAYWVGQATMEGYAEDATSGKLLWQGADRRAGSKALGRDTFNSWDDVDNAFKAWAEQFGKRLDALGVCP